MYDIDNRKNLVEKQVKAEFDFIVAHKNTIEEALHLCTSAFLEYFPGSETDLFFENDIKTICACFARV